MSQVRDQRLLKLQAHLTNTQAFLLANPQDIFYFSGFQILVPEEREAFLVVTKKQVHLLYASFSPLPEDLSQIKTHQGVDPNRLLAQLQIIQAETHFTELFFDENKMFVHEYKALQKLADCSLSPLDYRVTWRLRAEKDPQEIAATQRACDIAAQAFAQLKPQIKTGMTEIEVQDLLESLMRQLGSRTPAFPTIVAFGTHAALPHYQPGSNPLTAETSILLDFGATADHYRSDMTRSWWHGKNPDPEFIEIEKIIQSAYAAALDLGNQKTLGSLVAGDLDKAAREVICTAGFGEQFIHTTGHGVGLDIHEPPSINANNSSLLKADMVITIEPGIYVVGKFGYRYENTILVTDSGLKELTTSATIG